MFERIHTAKDNLIAGKLYGKLDESNLKTVHKRIHQILDKGLKVDFYIEFQDFEGYTPMGFWEDIKIDQAHLKDYGKMAFVGNKKWQEWAAKATHLFTGSDTRYFDIDNKEQAWAWVTG